jgi:nucleoside phosphorylase
MAPAGCLRRTDYTVAWISALPLELAAARRMLDYEHCPLPQDPSDTNIYTYGSIGGHNVVLACLPASQIGTNSAAVVVTQIRLQFSSIRYCLLVGIAGGVPSEEKSMRLGDIIVSQPNRNRSGVVQYDFGKSTPSGFERSGVLNAPPDVLLNAIAKVQALHHTNDGGSTSHSFLAKHTSKLLPILPSIPDMLFNAAYEHAGGSTCNLCDKSELQRPITTTPERGPMVFYGTIASGNMVIKDAMTRDKLSKELGGVLCFEMEAAGVLKSLPCLVIRGICGEFPASLLHMLF